MRWLDNLLRFLLAAWRWLRTCPNLSAWSLLGAVMFIIFSQLAGYHEKYLPQMPANGVELLIMKGWVEPSKAILAFYYLLPYLKLWAICGGIVFHIALLRALPDVRRLERPAYIACGFLALWAICSEVSDKLVYSQISLMGEPASMFVYSMKLVMILVLTLFPAGFLSYYVSRSTLDRYTLRSLLVPLFFCFVAFASLMIIMDLLDSLKDFQESKTPISQIIAFYANLLPFIFVQVAPATLLLSILYSLTRMSRANEVISMLGAGRSMGQILQPIFITAASASLISMAANYYWAPRAEGNRRAILRALESDDKKGSIMEESLLYRHETGRRTWFVASFPFTLHNDALKGVEVREEDEQGRISRAWYAPTARWWPDGKWSFYHCLEVVYQNGMPVEVRRYGQQDLPYRCDVLDLPETPWTIISSSLLPDFMSVPELVAYLTANADIEDLKLAPFRAHLHHRFALPWQCLALAFVAAPLGIAFSRRGVLGGIAGSIFIFFSLLFFNNLFLSLAKGGHMPAFLAVWMPHMILGAIGAALFYFRSQNRDIPKIDLGELIQLAADRLRIYLRRPRESV